MDRQFSQSAKRRGVKKFLLKHGVKFSEMESYIKEFFNHYGHPDLGDIDLNGLLDKAEKFFISLRRYTFNKMKK